jgi:hypothetical protein
MHNILELMLKQPFGYSANHSRKLVLMKDYIPILSDYVHSFIATYAFFLL